MTSRNLIFILLFFFSVTLFAQVDGITVRQISPEGGFCLKAIRIIKQDLLGYMWFGTEQGLIRYDSRNADWFLHDPYDLNGLPDNNISSIAIDNDNVVWIATTKGICFFDRDEQKFTRIPLIYENGEQIESAITNLAVDGNNNLWFSNNKYFGTYNRETKQFDRINKNEPINTNVLYVDYMKRIWIGSDVGDVYKVIPANRDYRKIVKGSGVNVSSIFIKLDEIIVGYQDNGVRRYGYNGKLQKYYKHDNLGNSIENVNVRSLLQDTYGRLWVGAYEGLYLYHNQEMHRISSDYYDKISNHSIHELFEDNQGGLWIGTWAGGVAYIHPTDNNFQNFRFNRSPYSLTNNIVSSFLQLKDEKILVGTEAGGLNVFDKRTKRFTTFSFSGDANANNIKSMKMDRYGGIWIGTFNKGIWYRATDDDKFKHIPEGEKDGKHITSRRIYALCEVDSGMLIGTYGGGLNFYNFRTSEISYFKSSVNQNNLADAQLIRCLFYDSSDNIWVGTNSGVYKTDFNTQQLEKYSSPNKEGSFLDNNTIYSITELSDKRIWFGLKSQGIIALNQKSGQLEEINADAILKGKDVYGIIEDGDNKVWITSNNGLVLYNPNNNVFRHFITKDGIQGDVFNPQAIFKDDKGFLYFGGTKGFTRINPLKIKLNTREPRILINKVVVNNKHAKYPAKLSTINYEELHLKPTETTIHIEFTTDNYLLPEKNRYKYRLVNYFDDWIEAGKDGSAMFVNLPNDDFVLEVKACNNDGVWNELPVRLPIFIEKYWYKTNVAYLIYSILILGAIGIVIRFYTERMKLRKKVLIEQIQHKHEEQMYEMKLKFFTNISHELRTPLTLITGAIKKMVSAEDIPVKYKEKLSVVNRNSDRLLMLINQTLSLRKSEKLADKLLITEFNIVKLVEEVHLHFKEQAKMNHIQFEFKASKSEILIEGDMQKIDKIVFNLLSNAFKNTPGNGKILVSVYDDEKPEQDDHDFANHASFGELESNETVTISILDSGKGIKSEDIGRIFDRFVQGEQTGSSDEPEKFGAGIGLSLCKEFVLLHHGTIKAQSYPGKRAKFTVSLPKKQDVQKILNDDLVAPEEDQFPKDTIRNVEDKKLEKNKFQLLIIEDNDDLRNYIGGLLAINYKIRYATNGKEGLDILNSSAIDLVISDVMMPEMDGYDFCRIVKSQMETSHVPVILLTALSSSENRIQGMDIGADAYLTKPFEEEVLLSQVSNLITQRIRVQQNFKNIFLADKTFEAGNLDNYFLSKLNKIIDERYTNEDFTVEELSAEIGLSRSQLHRKLVNLTNRSTSEYIRLYRIKKASELLTTDQYRVDEVAYRVGFNSPSYFSTCFKDVYNMSPKEYMNQS